MTDPPLDWTPRRVEVFRWVAEGRVRHITPRQGGAWPPYDVVTNPRDTVTEEMRWLYRHHLVELGPRERGALPCRWVAPWAPNDRGRAELARLAPP